MTDTEMLVVIAEKLMKWERTEELGEDYGRVTRFRTREGAYGPVKLELHEGKITPTGLFNPLEREIDCGALLDALTAMDGVASASVIWRKSWRKWGCVLEIGHCDVVMVDPDRKRAIVLAAVALVTRKK